jgi:3-oxoacyl-[acyl-carrier-protein] synthase-3
VALAECWRTGRFQPGDRILLIVPESGRFSFAFAQLTCVDPARSVQPSAALTQPTPAAKVAHLTQPTPVAELAPPARATAVEPADGATALLGDLARIWGDFELALHDVPIVARIETSTATMDDYRRLLQQLRQQVVEGGRWISRAASSFSADWFELRSAAIRHAADEHRDFQLIEQDYCACGGALDEIVSGSKNVGSEALSAYLFQQASQPDPIDLLGAMFVIEGLGSRKAAGWAQRLREDLGLRDDQVRFLTYHGEADDEHIDMLQNALRLVAGDQTARERIVRTAEIVARLYALQLMEVDRAPRR